MKYIKLENFIKLISNPFFYVFIGFRLILNFIKFPFYFLLFRKAHILSYISIRASIRNHKNITVGKYVKINPFVVLWPTSLKIGEKTEINPGTAIYGEVLIGEHVMIAPNCMISGGNHRFDDVTLPMMLQGSSNKGICIEGDVWIGANSVILDGVTLRRGTIVAAGSVVSKSTEPFSIVAGIPAIKIKTRYK